MPLSSPEECGQTLSRQAVVRQYTRYKEERGGNSGTHYVRRRNNPFPHSNHLPSHSPPTNSVIRERRFRMV